MIDYLPKEAEDPPEHIKSGMYLLNESDPLHKLEERICPEHMIRQGNWGMLLTSEEFWEYKKPFEGEIEISQPKIEYKEDYEQISYSITQDY
jgi:cobalamin biosynthesis Co2+ chelatase CbiK